jgi:hypothetical protein
MAPQAGHFDQIRDMFAAPLRLPAGPKARVSTMPTRAAYLECQVEISRGQVALIAHRAAADSTRAY